MGTGDAMAQALERAATEAEFSPSRLLTNVSWAAAFSAPFWTWWYHFLDRRWARGRVVGWVLASAALSPIFNGAFFCYNASVLHAVNDPRGVTSSEGRAALRDKVGNKLNTQLLPTVVRSCSLWVPFVRADTAGPLALPSPAPPPHTHPPPLTASTPHPRPRAQNMLNFWLVPLEYRMLSGGLVALGWNVFLSLEAQRTKNERPPWVTNV